MDVLALTIPHPEGHRWVKGELSALGWDQVIVRIATSNGLVGLGESYHVKNTSAVVAAIESSLRPLLIGESPFTIERHWQRMFQRVQQMGSAGIAAISGVDTALHDVVSRDLGIPLVTLLGGDPERRVPLYVGGHALGWRDIDDLDDLVTEARHYVDRGFKALKLRGGRALPDRGDVDSVKALREAFGDEIDILVDANGEYDDLTTSLRMAKELQDYNVFWLESPMTFSTAFHPEETADLSRRSLMRIASGGSTFSRFGFKRLSDAGGSDVLMVNTAKAGGISETRKILAMASASNTAYSPHCDGGLNAYSNLHMFGAAPPHIVKRMYMEWDPLWPFANVFTSPPNMSDGYANISSGPGIGTDLLPGIEDRYPLQTDVWFKSSTTQA